MKKDNTQNPQKKRISLFHTITGIALVVMLVTMSGCGGDSDTPAASSDGSNAAMSSVSSVLPDDAQTPDVQPQETTPEEPKETLTMGQKNALSAAKDYLSSMAFSYSGLIEQLEYEGYSTEDATYAADKCGADWNEQAAKCAKNYMDSMSFSRDSLKEQLTYEGFTAEQAEYGVTAAGY